MRFTPVALAAAALLGVATSGVQAGLSTCAQQIAFKLTNVFEFGDQQFRYDDCEKLPDGRGITSGIAGFCTGTGDAILVLKEYDRVTSNNNPLHKYTPIVQKLSDSESGSTKGLDGYCNAWKSLGKSNAQFQQVQRTIRDKLYTSKAADYASKLGLRLAISQAQLYDAVIQHGEGDDPDSLGWLIKQTNKAFTSDKAGSSGSTLSINGKKVDEIEWLNKFLDVRYKDLYNPHNKESRDVWRESVTRVKSYQFVVKQKQYTWDKQITALDNDGKQINVQC
ncbi:csn protein [Ramicandelaber brevisporus]|nr:csn protein [Ramicandelaber brevisporus]